MQVTEITAEGLKHELKVVIESADIEKSVVDKLTSIGKTAKLAGFRPGKVPLNVLRQRFGKAVMGDVLQETLDSTAKQVIADKSLRPALQPKVDIVKFDDGEDLEYTLEIEIMPEIEPSDFSKIKLERMVATVGEDDIAGMLTRLVDQQKTYLEAKDGAAEEGDAVVIDYVGSRGGEEFDGGGAKDYQLVLGSGQFIPGFEEQLVGAKAGEHRQVNLTFPNAYHSEELAGSEVMFEVDVKEVRAATTPPIDDDFAKAIGQDDLKALRERVTSQLETDFAMLSRERLKRKLLDALDDQHDFELPPGLVQAEFDSIWNRIVHERSHGHGHSHGDEGEDDEGKTDEELQEEYRAIAERRVRLGLLLARVGETNEITVSQDELNRAIGARAQQHPGQEREIFEYFQKNPHAASQLQAPLFEEKVVDFILELAEVTDAEATIEELKADPDADKPPGEKAVARAKSRKKPAAASNKTKAASAAKKAAPAKKPAAAGPAERKSTRKRKPAAKRSKAAAKDS